MIAALAFGLCCKLHTHWQLLVFPTSKTNSYILLVWLLSSLCSGIKLHTRKINFFYPSCTISRVFQLEVSFWFIRKTFVFCEKSFAGPYSFDGNFYYIFAHLGLYFVDNGTYLLFEFLNWLRSISINLIFHVTPKKKPKNFSLKRPMVSLLVWHVAPSCWK